MDCCTVLYSYTRLQSQTDGGRKAGSNANGKQQNGRLASSLSSAGGGGGGKGGDGDDYKRRRSPSLSRSLDQAFVRSGHLFGGLIGDVRRRLAPRVYWSDLRDGFHPQCLASFVFLYVASLAPLITFGGILGDYTGGNMVCRAVATTAVPQPHAPGPVTLSKWSLAPICRR